jgi:WD40 repeat protein
VPAQIWRTPGYEKTMAPMQLHKAYGGCHGDITCLDWSPDGRWIAVASKDLTARRCTPFSPRISIVICPLHASQSVPRR